jgi:secreted trypsin-like serine protease
MRRSPRETFPFLLALATISALQLHGCKQRPESDSRVKVVNGTIVNENGFPAVVRIRFELSSTRSAECTATWVSDRTLLTAAHCVEGADRSPGKLSVSKGTGIGQRAVKVISHPTYRPGCGDCNDIAIAIFKENTSPFYIPVALTQAQVGDPLTIVGFGNFNHETQSGSGVKRRGNNKVSAIDYRGRVDFVGLITPIGDKGSGESVTNSQGDSGGPMIIKSRVQGVSSSVNKGANNKNVGHYESVRAPAISNWLTKLATSGVYILGFSAGTESTAATDTTVNGDVTDEAVAPPSPSDNEEVAPPPPQVEPDDPSTPDAQPEPNPAPKPAPNPTPNPAPNPAPTPAPGGSTLLDCNRDYVKIRQGGQGVCQNSSSGFCYRYSGGDVRYSEGRTNCAASGSPGGAIPGLAPTPKPSTILDCNGNYSQIRAGGSGVCRNRTSGFCYRYSGGDVRYSLGRVSCP